MVDRVSRQFALESKRCSEPSDHFCGNGSVFAGLWSSAQQPLWLLICDCTEQELNSRWRHGLIFTTSSAAAFQPEAKYMSGQVRWASACKMIVQRKAEFK